MSDWQSFDLPKPVSTNNLYYTAQKTGKRHKTARYCTWLREAGWMIRAASPKVRQITGACEVSLTLSRSWRGDIDNIKCVLDAMQNFGVILNDKQVERITIERADIEGCRVSIRPIEIAEAA